MTSLSSIHRLWVFSDLHLSESEAPLYRSFIRTLDEPDSSNDVVVFAGDIFEIFVGNSAFFKKKHQLFFQALQALHRKNVKLYYIQGNHDFHLRDVFSECSVEVLDSELILGKIYIAHGDLVDQGDRGYLWMRKLFRSPFTHVAVRLLPGRIIQQFAETIARSDEQKERDLSSKPGEVPAVRPLYRAFAEEKKRQGFDFVILGHCHDLDDLQPFYFNMGYPPVHRQFLFYTAESNSFRRRVFTGI